MPVIERAAEFIPLVRPMHVTTSAAVTGEPSEKWWPALRAIVHEPSPLCVALSASSPTTVPVSSIVKSFSPTPWLTSAQPCWSVPGSSLSANFADWPTRSFGSWYASAIDASVWPCGQVSSTITSASLRAAWNDAVSPVKS